MIIEDLKNLGFSNVAAIETKDIPFEPELIEMCEMNRCGNYGRNYACPPHVGKTEDLIEKAKSYKNIVVFQKIYQLEDSFDIEGMGRGKDDFRKMLMSAHELCEKTLDKFLLLGAGGCTICPTCGIIDNVPCRFPNKAIASLESYAIQVSTLAKKCGMNYINGQNTVTYFGAVFCD